MPTKTTTAILTLAAALAMGGLGAIGGCARTVIENPLNTNYPAGDLDGDLNYWHTLPTRSAVCNDEGLHGIFLLADGEDTLGSYEARVMEAKKRGYLPEDWAEAANLSMRRGTLARSVCVICKIKGGVMMQVFGPRARFAIRELVYMQIMGDPSTEAQSITGLEFLGVISKAQDYINLAELAAEVPADEKAADAPVAAPVTEPTPEPAAGTK